MDSLSYLPESLERKQPGCLPVLRNQIYFFFFLPEDQVSLAFLKPVSPFQLKPRFCGNAIRSDLLLQ